MKLSRKQIVYGGLLAVAVVALGVDKIFFSAPSSAQGSLTPATPLAMPTESKPEPAAVAPPLPGPGEGLISDHLKTVPEVDLTKTGDAFSPSKAWMLFVRPPLPPCRLRRHHWRLRSITPALDFIAAHKLTGVLESHNGGAAIVDGEMLLIGQTLDGFTLTAVQSTTARFTNGTIVVELTIAQ